MARTAQDDTTTPTLYLAFELGGSKWLLGFGAQIADSPRRRTLRVADGAVMLARVREEIAAAKARFGLPPDAPVVSVYEAGRDGFWLHRGLWMLLQFRRSSASRRHLAAALQPP